MNTNKIAIAAAAALLLAAALPAAAAAKPDDRTIEQWIAEALRNDPRVVSPVTVKSDDGIVTLEGTVGNLAEQRYALMETGKIAGVRGVIDKLDVKPTFRYDADIASDIRLRLGSSPDPDLGKLTVTALDGMVTLRGTVGSWAARQEAELLASEVRGVSKISNEAVIAYGEPRTDAEIQHDVRLAFDRDVFLVDLPVDISVSHGEVTLTGAVGSAYARERAVDAAWAAGVNTVHDRLDVVWWEDHGERKAVAGPSDDQIAAAVRDELYEDLRVAKPYDIAVDSDLGHVTLSGTVPTYYQKRVAEQNAKNVVGVGWVTNYLEVNAQRRGDEELRTDVDQRIESDYLVSGQDLNVAVSDGVVTLKGSTNTYQERSHAVDLAAAVPGVQRVVDQIDVNWIWRYSDAELQHRIADRLRTHDATRWAAEHVKVKVDNGVATLTGNVAAWSERREAARIAFLTDGVLAVDNKLTVDGYKYPWSEWRYPDPAAHFDDYFEPLYY